MNKSEAMSPPTKSEQLSIEVKNAIEKIPDGYKLITSGLIIEADLIWDFVRCYWEPVSLPSPMKPGQKRAGFNQMTDIGRSVSGFIAVARKS